MEFEDTIYSNDTFISSVFYQRWKDEINLLKEQFGQIILENSRLRLILRELVSDSIAENNTNLDELIDRFLDLEAKEAEMIDLKTEMIGLKTELENKNRQIEEDKRAKSQLESELKKIRKEFELEKKRQANQEVKKIRSFLFDFALKLFYFLFFLFLAHLFFDKLIK